jgi:hypothetical protein
MLIIVPEDIESSVKKLCDSEPVERLRGLTKLLHAHADGLHVVVIPPAICRIIEGCTRLSEEQRGVAKKIRSKFSELSQLQSILPTYGQISIKSNPPAFSSGVWDVPLDWIARHGLSQTHLVCEDLYDCQISHEAARDFLHANNLARLELSLDHTSGGGVNTHRIFKAEAIDAQKICLCVVDSDKSNPSADAALGQTAQACLGISGNGIYELMISAGRELENELPVRLVDKLRNSWHGDRPSVNHAAFNAIHPNVWSFADLKTGLRRREIESMKGHDKAHWQVCANTLPHSKSACCPAGCAIRKEDICKQIVIEPLGRTLLKEAVGYLKDDSRIFSPKRFSEYIPSPNDAFWKDLGRRVAAYGVSIRINAGI